jgi:hypothetical protein
MTTIRKCRVDQSWCTAQLSPHLTAAEITAILGFTPGHGDPQKCTAEWQFSVDGEQCAVWDYRGARWSAFGPPAALRAVFGDRVINAA